MYYSACLQTYIGVTLNTYTHLQFDDVLEEMKKVCNGRWDKGFEFSPNEGEVMQNYAKLC